MKKIIVNRIKVGRKEKEPTISVITIENNKKLCVSLELPDLNNKSNISCIPCGIYEGFKRISSHNNARIGGVVYELKNVKDRQNIQFHIGNSVKDTLGCVIVGTFTDFDVVTQSTEAMKKLIEYLGDDNFICEVRNA